MTCIYIIEWVEWEWREYYILENTECPTEKEFEEDLADAMRKTAEELLQSGKPIDIRTLVEKSIEKMTQYQRVRIRGRVQLFSPLDNIFPCMCGKENIRILGKELCRRIHEYNKKYEPIEVCVPVKGEEE